MLTSLVKRVRGIENAADLTSRPVVIAFSLLFGVVIALSIAWRLYLVQMGPVGAVTYGFLDDGFFYTEIAKNIATGVGSTFDGIHPTNGYHPLWMALLVSLSALVPDYEGSFFTAQLSMAMMFNILSIYVLWRTTGLFTENVPVRMVATALYAIHPRIVYATINGMETSLLLFTFSVFSYWIATWFFSEERSTRLYTAIAIASSLVILTRTDFFIITSIVIFGCIVLRTREWRPLLVVWGSTCVLIALYALYNALVFGSAVPVNAAATTIETHMLLHVPLIPTTVVEAFWILKHGAFFLLSDLIDRQLVIAIPTGALLFGGLGVGLLLSTEARARYTRHFTYLMLLIGSSGVLLFINSFIRYWNSDYYFVFWNLIIAIMFTIVLAEVARRMQFAGFVAAVTLIIIGGASYYINYQKVYAADFAYTNGMYATVEPARWVDEHIPRDEKIGSFRRAGALSFFDTSHVIVNLDGKVNNDILPYKQRQEIIDYMVEYDIEYLVEHDGKIDELLRELGKNSGYRATYETIWETNPLPDVPPIFVYKMHYERI